jgi:FixJ family two-component response regulator
MQLQQLHNIKIEDDPQVNQTVRDIMASKYKRVVAYLDPVQAENELHLLSPDLVLLDLFLGSNNGLDILENLRNQGLIAPVIMMTAFSDIKMAIRAMKLGAEDFIIKPLDVEQLEISVEKALHNFDLRRRVNLLDEQLLREQPNEY